MIELPEMLFAVPHHPVPHWSETQFVQAHQAHHQPHQEALIQALAQFHQLFHCHQVPVHPATDIVEPQPHPPLPQFNQKPVVSLLHHPHHQIEVIEENMLSVPLAPFQGYVAPAHQVPTVIEYA